MQALIDAGVVGDCRPPDLMRFGFAPLYLRYVDVWDAVMKLAEVLGTRAWDQAQFRSRKAVT
jgi:kynureninase